RTSRPCVGRSVGPATISGGRRCHQGEIIDRGGGRLDGRATELRRTRRAYPWGGGGTSGWESAGSHGSPRSAAPTANTIADGARKRQPTSGESARARRG